MKGPLDGIKVLDLSRVLSGPFCTMILADLGADVVKIEKPKEGDPARRLGYKVGNDSSYFISVNRGKKSITLDISSPEGQSVLKNLIPHFDVLVENFIPGNMEKFNLDYPKVKRINPKIVYLSISGFGQDGPYSRRPALDIVVQAMGGIMSVTGEPGSPPVRPGVSIGDSLAGTFAALSIVTALYQRSIDGRGQYIDMSMLDCQLTLMENAFARYFASGKNPSPLGSRHPSAAPFQAFKARDGYFVVGLLTDSNEKWNNFCDAIDLPDLKADPLFQSNLSRSENVEALAFHLIKRFSLMPVKYWLQVLSVANVPCGPVNDVQTVTLDPQVEHRNMIRRINQSGKPWQVANTPFRFSNATTGPLGSSPDLGEHTEALLRAMLNISDSDLNDLKGKGIV